MNRPVLKPRYASTQHFTFGDNPKQTQSNRPALPRTCARCRHWHVQDRIASETGDCRRHAPKVITVEPSARRWPITHRGEGCGDWKSDGSGA